MSWKDLSKSSYIVESAKFTLARPSHPFTIPYQGPKIRYSEGDEISSVADYRFNLDFTGVPLGPDHFPCGYWHKNYIPPFTIIYTSLMYPLEVVDGVGGSVDIISGVHKLTTLSYDIGVESVDTVVFDIVSGIFRSVIITYNYQESLQTYTFDIISGQFKEVICDYIIPTEAVETSSFDLVSGRFRDSVINYDDALPESVQTSLFNIIGGSHAN